MAAIPNEQPTEAENCGSQLDVPTVSNLSKGHGSPLKPQEVDEDEEEDIDFNPFLKGTPSPEASSSLSSEVECLDGDVDADSGVTKLLNLVNGGHGCPLRYSGDKEEVTGMQTKSSPTKSDAKIPKKMMSTYLSQSDIETDKEQDNRSTCGSDINDANSRELGAEEKLLKPTMNMNDEDAICTRTRARYSLASFTLDELETFLQETDDEDDLQNVDDEEEYRKFLAAVLLGSDGDGKDLENGNVDDEDEDNDADFEIELEEALESDHEETGPKNQQQNNDCGRRPETRQNKRQKATTRNNRRLIGQTMRPLRPLLPILPSGSVAPFSTEVSKGLNFLKAPNCESSSEKIQLINGFAPNQIGQLYCLIHEHLQLLIQVFSLCVLDASRRQIASQVQGLILEMLKKRDEVLARKTSPYPCNCFCPPNVSASVTDEVSKFQCAQYNSESSPDVAQPFSQAANSQNMCQDKGLCPYVFTGQWVPFVSGPILSALDVAPLNLVGGYMKDIHAVVQDHRRRCVESGPDLQFERESLFPLPSISSIDSGICELPHRASSSAANTAPDSSNQQPPKKTLAATLVESSKKQSVALVPKEIAKLAQGFYPLFNPALFPRKPPPAAIVNRVLFTDAEDDLLALGMMEYNTDWKAIQHRFLPCKSKHQIFVRQKNRCSSKAPENPIKAVRRMKTSPLTVEEIARIHEGLKVYKSDWMSVWKYIVPYRDPSLLPRQWRIALGTQRSYKQGPERKAKRRLYESERKKRRAAYASEREGYESESGHQEINGGVDCVDNGCNAYVHEAFLADWRSSICGENPCSSLTEVNIPSDKLPQNDTNVIVQVNRSGAGEDQSDSGDRHNYPSASKYSQDASTLLTTAKNISSHMMAPNQTVSNVTSSTPRSTIYLRPYRSRGANSSRLVKLAPDLPPVNLPPSVRIVSQSAFKNYLGRLPSETSESRGSIRAAGVENMTQVHRGYRLVNARPRKNSPPKETSKSRPLKEDVTKSRPEEHGFGKDRCIEEEREFHMHPLLFQVPEDGSLPCYPFNCSSSSFLGFFPGNQPQLNLGIFHNPHPDYRVCNFNRSLESRELTLMSHGIDFHPLLQSTDEASNALVTACSNTHPSVASGGTSSHVQKSFGNVANFGQLARDTKASKASCSGEKPDGLDLEIHLNPLHNKDKDAINGDATVKDLMRSIITVPDSEITMEGQDGGGWPGETFPANSGNLVSRGHVLVMENDNNSLCHMDADERSHPEIVMEQEELSDSDEEIEENVEFECEEMADSEGEDMTSCNQLAEIPDKEEQNLASEGNPVADDDDKQCQGGITPSLGSSIEGQRKNDTCSSWLRLDSRPPDSSLQSSARHTELTTDDGSTAKRTASGRPNRSCKKTRPSGGAAVDENPAETEQQLTLSPFAVPASRKSRKRASRADTSLNIGSTAENSTGNTID